VSIALGPGLAKTRAPRLVVRVVRELFRVDLHALDALFATADVVSEGCIIDGRWTGSTAVDLQLASSLTFEQERAVAHDPHLRLRLVRLATREAAARAPGPLGPANTDVSLRFERGIVRIVVDVDARVGHAPDRAADGPTLR
jgi:hypothetical protein